MQRQQGHLHGANILRVLMIVKEDWGWTVQVEQKVLQTTIGQGSYTRSTGQG